MEAALLQPCNTSSASVHVLRWIRNTLAVVLTLYATLTARYTISSRPTIPAVQTYEIAIHTGWSCG